MEEQGITNTLALPIDKDVVQLSYCVHTLEQPKKIHSNLNSLNTFTQKNRFTLCEIGSNKVKNFQKLDPMP
jgi:hypothetical protein